ncbi:hypothetical protein H9Q72_010831 [Fusarium xylarioides]|uniref:Uncharacterized protein n=1 Tax=Fusarium xylarioides TaxID=221167 RepID=A0A9P7HP37_9HYPO|nr:hypothetical protein H9Q72_010831 [Fusarium xylarioides]
MIEYTNQPFHSGRKRGSKAKKGGSNEEPAAQVVANLKNQAQPVPIGNFMPTNEFVRPMATIPANMGAVANNHREFDAQSIYPGDACLFGSSTVGASTLGWVMVKSGPFQGALPTPQAQAHKCIRGDLRGRTLTRETEQPRDKGRKSRKSDATERAPEEG